MLKRALAVPAVLLPLLATAACGSDTTSPDSAGAPTSPTSPATSAMTTAASSPAATGGTTCSYVAGGQAAKKASLPPAQPTVKGKVPVTIHTSVGDLHLTLDAAATPCTVGSFVSLAQQGYYDGSHCHRLGNSPGFQMLQCGDPTGTGMGGPGYTIPDELTGKETYPAGTLAMANTGQPNTGGGQFFMVFGPTQLPPQYTVFGTFDAAAVKTLQQVAAKGVASPGPDGTGEPKQRVEFDSISVG